METVQLFVRSVKQTGKLLLCLFLNMVLPYLTHYKYLC